MPLIPITLAPRNVCPLCRSDKAEVHIPFPEIPVVRCGSCTFTYSSKVLPEDDLNSYYTDNFGSLRHKQGQMVNSIVNSMVLEKLIDFESITTLLDVGTGYGYLLDKLGKRHKLDATGVELSRQEADYAQNTLGLHVVNSLLGDSGLKKGSYDLVTSFEVIEHVPDPGHFIRELTSYVKPGGHLLIMTDNFDSCMARSLGAAYPKWIPHSHINHFSPASLARALEAANELEIVKSKSYTSWEILLRNAYYQLRGIRKTPAEAFNLAATLESEMHGVYKLFTLRRLFNVAWATFSLSDSMDGDLMYFLSRKKA